MTTICDLDADNCGTGLEYPPTVRVPTSGTGGTEGTTPSLTISEIIDKLAGVIEFSHLAQSLRTRIDIINTLEHGFNEISTKVVTDNAVMAQQLIGLRGDLTNAVSYINNQTTIQLNERVALVNSVNQLVASLGDGLSAALQEESTVRAEQTGALFAEKTVKTDLAGNVSGYGLSSYVDKTGAVSDFRVAADRFSIAPPAYVSPAPPPYNQMHNGKVWVDTSGGGKGVTKWWNGYSWQTTPVKEAQPFVYLTTPQTLPDGTVVQPGLYVNSASITKLTADKIDTRGLTIRDTNGNVVFDAGTGLNLQQRIPGLGKLATANEARIGETVRVWNGTSYQLLHASDFVNTLSKINSGTISNFMESAAIGNAYIGNAAVSTLKIGQDAVTVPRTVTFYNQLVGNAAEQEVARTSITMNSSGVVYAHLSMAQGFPKGDKSWEVRLYINGVEVFSAGGAKTADSVSLSGAIHVAVLEGGTRTVDVVVRHSGSDQMLVAHRTLFVMGAKR